MGEASISKRGGVWTIPTGAPFLQSVVEGLGRIARPAEIEAASILTPSRRACLALEEAFVAARGGAPTLLPEIRPIGEVDPAELVLRGSVEAQLKPAIHPLRRQLLLAKLIGARASAAETTHDAAFRLAGALAAFLDDAQNEGADLARLEAIAPEEYAEHWRANLEFLTLLRDVWPAILESDEAALDPAARRARGLELAAQSWPEASERWTVLVGVTGHVPAVARFAARLVAEKGATLIIPGLDLDLDPPSLRALGDSDDPERPGWAQHPEWALSRLLALCGVERARVKRWPGTRAPRAARMALLACALRPPAAGVASPRVDREALEGLATIEAPDLAIEAKAIALLMRETLERAEERAALITPDRNLARRVSVELGRWGLRVDDSAGRPLDQTPPGGFALLAAHAVIEALAPVALLAWLKHPFARFGLERAELRRRARALELRLLRGPRRSGGIEALRASLDLERHAEKDGPIDDLLSRIRDAIAPMAELLAQGEEIELEALIGAHFRVVEAAARGPVDEEEASPLWARDAGRAALAFAQDLESCARGYGPIAASAYPSFLAVSMGAIAVRPGSGEGHPRLAILGRLEARLHSADRVVIASMNDEHWPSAIDAGPWLNPAMRRDLGMPPIEQKIGFAAHDWREAMGAREVFLTRARKNQAGQPTTPSRWLSRLDATLRATGREGLATLEDRRWLDWAEALDAPRGPARPIERPNPKPPLARRPRRLPVTDVVLLLEDPYALFAKRILGLRPLDPLDADPGAPERGKIAHAALEKFAKAHPAALPDDPAGALIAIGDALFERWRDQPEVTALWRPRFLDVARWFAEWERARRADGRNVLAEREGALILDTPGGPFELTGRADRIERLARGALAIADYKTGKAPKPAEVRKGAKQQLPLEAAIARAGGFAGAPASPVEELLYLELRGGDPAGAAIDPCGADPSPEDLADAALGGLRRLIAAYDDPAFGYVALPRPEPARAFDRYRHLARADEWLGGSG